MNNYTRLLAMSKEDPYCCFLLVACINKVKSELNVRTEIQERLFRIYIITGRLLKASDNDLYFKTFWEDCYKDAMKKLVKTPQENHLKFHKNHFRDV